MSINEVARSFPEHQSLVADGWALASINPSALYRGLVCDELTYTRKKVLHFFQSIIGNIVSNSEQELLKRFVKNPEEDKKVRQADIQKLGFDTSASASLEAYLNKHELLLGRTADHAFLPLIKPSGLSGFIFLPYGQSNGAIYFNVFDDSGAPLKDMGSIATRAFQFANQFETICKKLKAHFQVQELTSKHFKSSILTLSSDESEIYDRVRLNEKNVRQLSDESTPLSLDFR